MDSMTPFGMHYKKFTITTANAAEIDFGNVGDPIDLVVGYQPYYTEAGSGVVMKGKKFYEKYLPAGSTVEFQIGLAGGVIVNAMLAGKQHIGYMGDMPAIVATTKERVADVRIVATAGSNTIGPTSSTSRESSSNQAKN